MFVLPPVLDSWPTPPLHGREVAGSVSDATPVSGSSARLGAAFLPRVYRSAAQAGKNRYYPEPHTVIFPCCTRSDPVDLGSRLEVESLGSTKAALVPSKRPTSGMPHQTPHGRVNQHPTHAEAPGHRKAQTVAVGIRDVATQHCAPGEGRAVQGAQRGPLAPVLG